LLDPSGAACSCCAFSVVNFNDSTVELGDVIAHTIAIEPAGADQTVLLGCAVGKYDAPDRVYMQCPETFK
jgi:hypothetical protein